MGAEQWEKEVEEEAVREAEEVMESAPPGEEVEEQEEKWTLWREREAEEPETRMPGERRVEDAVPVWVMVMLVRVREGARLWVG